MPRVPTPVAQPAITVFTDDGHHVYFVVYDLPPGMRARDDPSQRARLERQANGLVGALCMN